MKGGPIHLTQKLMTSSSVVEQTAAFKMLALGIIELLNHCQVTTTKVLIAPMACANMKEKCGILRRTTRRLTMRERKLMSGFLKQNGLTINIMIRMNSWGF